jgi:hypothetical protein
MDDAYRKPATSSVELERADLATGTLLDNVAIGYGVARLPGEDDNGFRIRLHEAINVSRASAKVQLGESLMPPPLSERAFLEQRREELLTELKFVDGALAEIDDTP